MPPKESLQNESDSNGGLIRNSEGALRVTVGNGEDKIMLIFFGIHTVNVVNLSRRKSVQLGTIYDFILVSAKSYITL